MKFIALFDGGKLAGMPDGCSIDYLCVCVCVCLPLASRAVQRSLAIIRQAKQKKEKKKEYCMYYNRFGKCNRGERCPYIHDPEKVAVCTRYPPFPSRQLPVDAGPISGVRGVLLGAGRLACSFWSLLMPPSEMQKS